jgi:hypothetical protein
MVGVHVVRVQPHDRVIVSDRLLVAAQLGEAVGAVVVQPRAAGAREADRCRVVLDRGLVVAQLAERVAAVAVAARVVVAQLDQPGRVTAGRQVQGVCG